MTTDQISALLKADPRSVVSNDEARYRAQIARAVELVDANADLRPIVLLAGPSGSGKTSTAMLLSQGLRQKGRQSRTICMDDYFLPLSVEEQQRLRRNELDLEAPARIDVPLFQRHLDEMLACREFALPRYDFPTSSRVYDQGTFRRAPGSVVVIEGIHALNPAVTGHEQNTTRLYVSVRTRIAAHDGSVLHPSLIRLARRMLRDRLCRGRDLTQTLAMWQRVDEGEQKNIMPFKPRAHESIDSFFSCELSVYRDILLPELERLVQKNDALGELVKVMRELPSLPIGELAHDSMMREFVGGSSLL